MSKQVLMKGENRFLLPDLLKVATNCSIVAHLKKLFILL